MTIIVRQVTPGTIRVTSHRDSIVVGRIELSLTEARTLAHDLLAATDTRPAPTRDDDYTP